MKIGLVGCGGMGTTHNLTLKALSETMDIEVVALADCREAFLEKAALQWPNARKYEFGKELIASEQLNSVHICLPSYLHTEHAIAAMEKGMNVFLEKPVCLTKNDCERLLEVKNRTGVKAIVGQVVRFYEEYQYLKKIYEEKTYGKLKSIVLQRLSGDVTWGFEDWFHDEAKSGSVVLDLHVHDVDFLRYMLGEPDHFEVKATAFENGLVNHIITQYQYGDTLAMAEGLWDESPGLTFEASFRANFEQATIVYSREQEPNLMVYLKDGTSFKPTLEKEFERDDLSAGINVSNLGPYYSEIKYFIECLKNDQEPDVAPLKEGIKSVLLAINELQAAKEYIRKP